MLGNLHNPRAMVETPRLPHRNIHKVLSVLDTSILPSRDLFSTEMCVSVPVMNMRIKRNAQVSAGDTSAFVNLGLTRWILIGEEHI